MKNDLHTMTPLPALVLLQPLRKSGRNVRIHSQVKLTRSSGGKMGWDVTKVASSLTEAEEKFEHQRRIFGLVAGPLALLICAFVPPLPDTTPLGMKTLGVFL